MLISEYQKKGKFPYAVLMIQRDGKMEIAFCLNERELKRETSRLESEALSYETYRNDELAHEEWPNDIGGIDAPI